MRGLKGEKNPSYKHGLTAKHPLYSVWQNMKRRCDAKKLKQFKDYGGRGIKVCVKWNNNFLIFFNWAISNGWSKELTLDRKNNNKNYSPLNCRFVDRIVQGRNQRTRITNKLSRGIDLNKGSFRARICVDKKPIFIGRFKSLRSAIKARKNYIKVNKLDNFHS